MVHHVRGRRVGIGNDRPVELPEYTLAEIALPSLDPSLFPGHALIVTDGASGGGSALGISDGSAWVITDPDAGGGGGAFSGVRLLRTSDQSIPNSTETNMEWQSEEYDDGDWFDGGVSTTQIIVPAGVTRILVEVGASIEANATGTRKLFIRKNGLQSGATRISTASAGPTQMVASAVLDVVATDIITARVQQDSGVALNLEYGGGTSENTFMAVTALG